MERRRVAFGPTTAENTDSTTAIAYAGPSAATPSTAGFDVGKILHGRGRARSPLPSPLGSSVGEDEDEEYIPSPITSASGDGRSVDDRRESETDSSRTEDTRTSDRNSRSAAWWEYQNSATSRKILREWSEEGSDRGITASEFYDTMRHYLSGTRSNGTSTDYTTSASDIYSEALYEVGHCDPITSAQTKSRYTLAGLTKLLREGDTSAILSPSCSITDQSLLTLSSVRPMDQEAPLLTLNGVRKVLQLEDERRAAQTGENRLSRIPNLYSMRSCNSTDQTQGQGSDFGSLSLPETGQPGRALGQRRSLDSYLLEGLEPPSGAPPPTYDASVAKDQDARLLDFKGHYGSQGDTDSSQLGSATSQHTGGLPTTDQAGCDCRAGGCCRLCKALSSFANKAGTWGSSMKRSAKSFSKSCGSTLSSFGHSVSSLTRGDKHVFRRTMTATSDATTEASRWAEGTSAMQFLGASIQGTAYQLKAGIQGTAHRWDRMSSAATDFKNRLSDAGSIVAGHAPKHAHYLADPSRTRADRSEKGFSPPMTDYPSHSKTGRLLKKLNRGRRGGTSSVGSGEVRL